MDFAQARMYASKLGRFSGTDPFNPIVGKQNASNPKEAEAEFVNYISQPQHWNQYAYSLNNPLKFTDPDGYNPITVRLNVIFDSNSNYTKDEIQQIKDTYVAQLQKNYDDADINFEITYHFGVASKQDQDYSHGMDSGVVPGAINAFFSKNSVGSSTEVTHEDKGEVWIQTGVPLFSTTDNLTHGVTHALGITQGKNGYDKVYNKGDPPLISGAKGAWNYLTGNSAEAAVVKVVRHMVRAANDQYTTTNARGETVNSSRPDLRKEYKILREGAKKYEKK